MRISEVSKLLDMPITTIRFYEQEGVLSPTRSQNSYREYSTVDVYNLMECIRYRNMGLSVKEIAASLHDEPLCYLRQKVAYQAASVEEQVKRNELKLKCLRDFEKRLEMLEWNVGNRWIVWQPARDYVIMESGTGEGLGRIDSQDELLRAWIQELPFVYGVYLVDAKAVLNGQKDRVCCVLMTEKSLAERLRLPAGNRVLSLPEQVCMRTILNSREGILPTQRDYQAICGQVDERYEICGALTVRLLARCCDEKNPQRYWEIMVPVRKKQNKIAS